VEVNDQCIVVTDPSCPTNEQLYVSVSEADTSSVSVLQEWKKRRESLENSVREDVAEEASACATESREFRIIRAKPFEQHSHSSAEFDTGTHGMLSRRVTLGMITPMSSSSSPAIPCSTTRRESRMLPPEILFFVFKFVPWNEILRSLALVSKEWLSVTRLESLWRKVYRKTYGSYYDDCAFFKGALTPFSFNFFLSSPN
jgi:hypothetical protein